MKPLRIRNISQAEVANSGHSIQWHFVLEDGKTWACECPADLVLQMMLTFHNAACAAARERSAEQFGLTYAEEAVGVRAGRLMQGFVLEFAMKRGFPMQVSLSEQLAKDAIKRIDEAFSFAPPEAKN
jgi:hypothetical protein